MTTQAARLESLSVTPHHAKIGRTCYCAHSLGRSVQVQTEHCGGPDTPKEDRESISLEEETFQVCANPESTRHDPSTSSKGTPEVARSPMPLQGSIPSTAEAHIEPSSIRQACTDLTLTCGPSPLPASLSLPIASKGVLTCSPLIEPCSPCPTPRKRPFAQVRQASVIITETLLRPNIDHAHEEYSLPIHGSFGGTLNVESQI